MSDTEEERNVAVGWLSNPPAPDGAIQSLMDGCGFRLPEEYLDLLRLTNGGEGPIGIAPGWLQLWPAEQVLELNRAYNVADFIPGFFGFGSSGGGELFAFRIREMDPLKVYMIPFIPMDEAEALVVANGLSAFINTVGHE